MNNKWRYCQVPLKFQLSDKTLFAPRIWLQMREIGLTEETPPVAELSPPTHSLESGSQGYLIRSLPVSVEQPPLQWFSQYFCYVPSQYPRYYIDLRQSFSNYKQNFSSKTRSTINRKIKKYAEHCGGTITWKVYKTEEEIHQFFLLARTVSTTTYQERLLKAGLPDSEEFFDKMKKLAREGQVRAYILFDGERSVSYLYCPIRNGVLLYEYLGYDPKYANWSVGTVLQWYALENIFEEGCFQLFDFTEGEGGHKRLFSTHRVQCADVFFLRRNLRNLLLARTHKLMNTFSKWSGDIMHQLGLKVKIKKLIRFGR